MRYFAFFSVSITCSLVPPMHEPKRRYTGGWLCINFDGVQPLLHQTNCCCSFERSEFFALLIATHRYRKAIVKLASPFQTNVPYQRKFVWPGLTIHICTIAFAGNRHIPNCQWNWDTTDERQLTSTWGKKPRGFLMHRENVMNGINLLLNVEFLIGETYSSHGTRW